MNKYFEMAATLLNLWLFISKITEEYMLLKTSLHNSGKCSEESGRNWQERYGFPLLLDYLSKCSLRKQEASWKENFKILPNIYTSYALLAYIYFQKFNSQAKVSHCYLLSLTLLVAHGVTSGFPASLIRILTIIWQKFEKI